MALILHIETATEICSVSLANAGLLLAVKESPEPRSHASQTAVLIQQILQDCGYNFRQLDAVAVSRGPGSYTGLRIGVATAKGLCYATDKPLIAVDTLQAMAGTYILDNKVDKDVLLVPMIDARRMEVYGAVLDVELNYLEPVKAEILNPDSFMIFPTRKRIVFGDGAIKSREFYENMESVFIDESFQHSSKGMIKSAYEFFLLKKFENIAYFEPYYLKEFVGNLPKV